MKRLKNYAILLLTIAVLVFQQSEGRSTPPARLVNANDEYEVLSALINELYAVDDVKSIVITNPTCCDTAKMDLQTDVHVHQLKPVSSEALEDYVARNRQSITLGKEFKLKIDYRIVPYVEIENSSATSILIMRGRLSIRNTRLQVDTYDCRGLDSIRPKIKRSFQPPGWPSLCAAKVTM